MIHKIDEGSSMKYKEKFDEFFQLMEDEMEGHHYIYGDSWIKSTPEYLIKRLQLKMEEFELSKNPKKLISISNFAMLLYIKSKGELK